MSQFQRVWSKASESLQSNGNKSEQQSRNQSGGESEDPTMKAAGKIASAAGRELSSDEKKKAGSVLHYTFGTSMGAVYGAAMELASRDVRRNPELAGMGFGTLLFAGADEIAVPALQLSERPDKTPLSSHLYSLASHVVYGLAAGTVYRALRRAL
jgi:hypothetical protein